MEKLLWHCGDELFCTYYGLLISFSNDISSGLSVKNFTLKQNAEAKSNVYT